MTHHGSASERFGTTTGQVDDDDKSVCLKKNTPRSASPEPARPDTIVDGLVPPH